MSKKISVVGVDPSMSNFGLAVGTLDLETDELEIHGLTLVVKWFTEFGHLNRGDMLTS
ncbi:hypothetical protein HC463_22470, partial [Escherichia coli]|nr:hypothetical protein [Escherichia coli]